MFHFRFATKGVFRTERGVNILPAYLISKGGGNLDGCCEGVIGISGVPDVHSSHSCKQ